MGFDAAWFDELRSIDWKTLKVREIKGIYRYVPHVGELRETGVVSLRFYDETMALIDGLRTRGYRFDWFFRAEERGIYDFPEGMSGRKQWNIGFHAGENASEDYVRIGIGFRFQRTDDRASVTDALLDYVEFQNRVKQRPLDFDQVFASLGGYMEPSPQDQSEPLSSEILTQFPNLDDWRFFGKKLSCADEANKQLLKSIDKVADEAVTVFEKIQHAGFG